ncbi:MAG: STAS domain-containing protein [Phycisphaerales bacterium]|jgi:anti-sigma B factor antagonist|nr:STAS domain-containing protein [Phycisphaeraceae bacterium]
MSSLSVFVEQKGQAVVASVSGSADLGSNDLLQKEIDKVIALHPKVVVLDLAKLTFINSLGIGGFLRLQKSVKAAGGAVRVAGATPYVTGVFAASKLTNAFPMFPTVDAAASA